MTLESRTVNYLLGLAFVTNVADRRPYLYIVFGNDAILNGLGYEGSPRMFCARLVERCARFGSLADGRAAIDVLLTATKEDVGREDQLLCDALIAEWRDRRSGGHPAAQEAPPQTQGEPPRKGTTQAAAVDGKPASPRDDSALRTERAANSRRNRYPLVVGGAIVALLVLTWILYSNWQVRQRQASAVAPATAVVAETRATAEAEAPIVQATPAAEAVPAYEGLPPSLRGLADRFGLLFVEVPSGSFTMGSPDSGGAADERPQHSVFVDTFWIGQTEVTNAQYRLFAEAGGYDEPSYWTDAGWQWRQESGVTQPGCWGNGDFDQPDQPVVCLSWYEAVAYARWLAAESDAAVRLPSEAEWEKACRDGDGRTYPWGNQEPNDGLVNYDDNVGHTTPVGAYPDGASPYGVLDMAGNVWEWTSSKYDEERHPYPYDPDDGREDPDGDNARSLRGGSFWNSADWMRCAYRDGFNPVDGNGDFGFRVVVSSPGS